MNQSKKNYDGPVFTENSATNAGNVTPMTPDSPMQTEGNGVQLVTMGNGTNEMETAPSTSPGMTTKPSANEQVLTELWKEGDGKEKDDDNLLDNDGIAPVAFVNGMEAAVEEKDEVQVDIVYGDSNGQTPNEEADGVHADTVTTGQDEDHDEDDDLLSDERYAKVLMFFQNEVLVTPTLRKIYFKMCIKNGIDSLEALKAVSKDELIDIGIDPLDVGTILIKCKMMKL